MHKLRQTLLSFAEVFVVFLLATKLCNRLISQIVFKRVSSAAAIVSTLLFAVFPLSGPGWWLNHCRWSYPRIL